MKKEKTNLNLDGYRSRYNHHSAEGWHNINVSKHKLNVFCTQKKSKNAKTSKLMNYLTTTTQILSYTIN